MNGQLEGHKRWTVPLSLALSFLANDGEELLTIVPSLPETLDRVSERTAGRVPIPGLLRDIDQTHINVGVAMMGALCAAAVADGVRSRGGGALYQDFQWVFRAARPQPHRRLARHQGLHDRSAEFAHRRAPAIRLRDARPGSGTGSPSNPSCPCDQPGGWLVGRVPPDRLHRLPG